MSEKGSQSEQLELVDLVHEANAYIVKGLATHDEICLVVNTFPDVFVARPDSTLGFAPLVETPKTEPAPAAVSNARVSFLPETPVIQARGGEKIVPANMSLDGRNLDINFREQKLLHFIRAGVSRDDILTNAYGHLSPNAAEKQLEKDVLHVTEVLNMHGSTLVRETQDGVRFVERRREIRSSKPTPSFNPVPQNLPKRDVPLTPPLRVDQVTHRAQTDVKTEFQEANLAPTEQIAYTHIKEHPPKSPITQGKWLANMNKDREKLGMKLLTSQELHALTQRLSEEGYPVFTAVKFGKRVYFRTEGS